MESFYRTELKRLMRLMLPVLVAQIIVIGMSFVDTIMAGQVSALDLAGVAVGSSLLNPVSIFTQGVLMAVTPLIANHWGAKRIYRIGATLLQSLWLAVALGLIATGVIFTMPSLFNLLDIAPELQSLASDYLRYVAFGLPAFALYQALRGLNEGLANTRIIMLVGLLGIAANIPLNYILIHGIGIPAFGGAGCGIATAIVYWLMALVMFGYVVATHKYKSLNLFSGTYKPVLGEIVSISKLGLPIAGAIFFEVSLFSVVAILLAPLGETIVAAHQIALNFAALIFMIPLSLGIVTTVRIGHLLGEGKPSQARQLCLMTLTLCTAIALITAVITLIFRRTIAEVYTDDSQVIHIAMSLFMVASAFQVSDAIQAVCSGALRGYQDTKSILVITLICYWPVGLVSGSVLCFTDWLTAQPLGAIGFWYAFVISLTLASVLLGYRLYQLSYKTKQCTFTTREYGQSV